MLKADHRVAGATAQLLARSRSLLGVGNLVLTITVGVDVATRLDVLWVIAEEALGSSGAFVVIDLLGVVGARAGVAAVEMDVLGSGGEPGGCQESSHSD